MVARASGFRNALLHLPWGSYIWWQSLGVQAEGDLLVLIAPPLPSANSR